MRSNFLAYELFISYLTTITAKYSIISTLLSNNHTNQPITSFASFPAPLPLRFLDGICDLSTLCAVNSMEQETAW